MTCTRSLEVDLGHLHSGGPSLSKLMGTRHHQKGRWQASIGRVAGIKDLYLGNFATEEEVEAYDIATTSSSLLVGGAAKRLKVSSEVEHKPSLLSNNHQLPPYSGGNTGSNVGTCICTLLPLLLQFPKKPFKRCLSAFLSNSLETSAIAIPQINGRKMMRKEADGVPRK
ncbi:hypothetical protein L2E82_17809 [Cichorium intybus]|uniref:Uncharacterized protein n=1 Tax=Cichorium intybus TaxID=13427 RepID=A0ACB9F9K8_CICIN|nr:hypothetical protein L2E82_17809 [Cichorium intybus]